MPTHRAKLAADVHAKLLQALGAGSSRDEAARHAGIPGAELEERIEREADLADAVLNAEASADVANVASVRQAAKGGDWRAATFLLGRRRGFNPDRDCGARTKRTGEPCEQFKGHRTDHPGFGRCWLHGGRGKNGNAGAAREKAERAIARLGIPVGTGDPMVLLAKAVQHAEGFLEGSAAVLQEIAADATAQLLDVETAADLHAEAIRSAARTGKAAVDANVADRLAALDERASQLLMRFVGELLERAVPAKRRPEITVWARERLGELAAEYETGRAVH